jgi:hypothetical protein
LPASSPVASSLPTTEHLPIREMPCRPGGGYSSQESVVALMLGTGLGERFRATERRARGARGRKKAICWPFVKPSDGLTVDPLLTMNVRRGSIHAGFRTAVRVCMPRGSLEAVRDQPPAELKSLPSSNGDSPAATAAAPPLVLSTGVRVVSQGLFARASGGPSVWKPIASGGRSCRGRSRRPRASARLPSRPTRACSSPAAMAGSRAQTGGFEGVLDRDRHAVQGAPELAGELHPVAISQGLRRRLAAGVPGDRIGQQVTTARSVPEVLQ